MRLRSFRPLTVLLAAACVTIVTQARIPSLADPPVEQGKVVSAVPRASTPDVQDGQVRAIGRLGRTIFLGGNFTSVAEHGGAQPVSRNNIVAFDATTGKIRIGFRPAINGEVEAVVPGPNNSVFVAGRFTTVNGRATRVDRLNATTGRRVAGWTPPVLNGITQTLTTLNGTLYIGGAFTRAGGDQHCGLVAVSSLTGRVRSSMTLQLTGRHGTGMRQGPLGPKRIAIDPSGTTMVVVGNFTAAADSVGDRAYAEDQVVRLNVTRTTATVDTLWSTKRYSAPCANNSFDSYVRDVQFSPSGSYFVIVATGGHTFDTNTDGTRALCDTVARWETSDTGSDVAPSWVDYTGNDTFWSVAVTGTAVYAGGHQRWVNNSEGNDEAGEGAVARPGIVALDPVNGLPLAWNPGRNPRGAGTFALLATPTGLWVGSDTDYIGSYKYKHRKIAFFPLDGGHTIAPASLERTPGNVYEAGPLVDQHPEVLYRVNAGGPTIQAYDDGPDWAADDLDSSPYRNSESRTSHGSTPIRCAELPSSTPCSIFESDRWDPGRHRDGRELKWHFPVPAGTTVTVRLFFANHYAGTSRPGQRAFDVTIEGRQVLSDYDIVADAGNRTAVMRPFGGIVSDGHINITFTHDVQNPLVNGIEIIQTDPTPPPGADGDKLTSRHLATNGTVGSTTLVDSTSMDWTHVRGAFLLNGVLYYGRTDNTFHKRTLDGTTFGEQEKVDPYNDPFWSRIKNGSGGTYRGRVPDLYGQLPNVSSMFFSRGRIYYTLVGDRRMYCRYFTPDSGVIGADQFTVHDGGKNWRNLAGAFATGTTLYYASKTNGVLHRIAWETDHATGVSSVVDDTGNWASHSLFLRSD